MKGFFLESVFISFSCFSKFCAVTPHHRLFLFKYKKLPSAVLTKHALWSLRVRCGSRPGVWLVGKDVGTKPSWRTFHREEARVTEEQRKQQSDLHHAIPGEGKNAASPSSG